MYIYYDIHDLLNFRNNINIKQHEFENGNDMKQWC